MSMLRRFMGNSDFLRDHNYKIGKFLTTNTLLATFVMMTSVFAYGFENSVLSTIQAMNHFERTFGEYDAKTKKYTIDADHLAYLNSFPLIAYALGVFGATFIGEKFGRRIVFFGMNCICLIGVVICYVGRTYALALVGRMVINIHVGAEAYLVPMWLAEIVPAAIRGSMVAVYAFSHIFAGFIASIVTNSTSQIKGEQSWTIPIAVMFAFPSICILMQFLLPESPRWLLRQGHHDEAVAAIYYLNSATKDYPAETEAQLITETINESTTKGTWRDLFRGMNTRRTLIGLLAAGANQLTGQSFASTYGTVFLKELNTIDPFQGTMIKRACMLLGCIFIIAFLDKIGRRRISLVSGFICTSSLWIMGGLGTVTPKQRGSDIGIVAMSFLFPISYMIGFGAPMTVVKAEVPHTSLRDKSTLLFWTFANISNFVVTFTVPYMLKPAYGNLGGKVGFVFGSTSIIIYVLIVLFVPEMKGKSLEEVDEMFEKKIPAWKSKDFRATGIAAAVTDIENHVKGGADAVKTVEVERVESNEKRV